MILFPAIDLKDGACVRLVQGAMASATVFSDAPATQANAFAEAGFRHLHVVDLDGAFAGRSRNGEAVEAILAAVPGLRVQLGGGLRDLRAVEAWLERGVNRVILGTAAVRDPDFVREAARLYPGRVVVGVDARAGLVVVEGWAARSTLAVAELAERFADAGVAAVLYTDVDRDGLMRGVNWDATFALADVSPVPVIASGGLGSLEELRDAAARAHPNVEGVVAGRALYDGRLDPRGALALLSAMGARAASSPARDARPC